MYGFFAVIMQERGDKLILHKKMCKLPLFLSSLIPLISIVVILWVSLFFSADIANLVREGITLCYRSVIGAVFPFAIITDLFISLNSPFSLNYLRRSFERIFNINANALFALIVGISCGFPLGVKVASDLYKNSLISKEECERLIAFSNNTGPAFTVAAVGGMRKSISEGVILYISMVISSVIVGVILGIGKKPSTSAGKVPVAKFNLINSITSSAYATITVSSFVLFFYTLSGLILRVINNEAVFAVIVPFIEIGTASSFLAKCRLARPLTLTLTSFAVSFSGLSVHLQAKSFLRDTDISTNKYYIGKLLQGIISAIISYLFYLLLI